MWLYNDVQFIVRMVGTYYQLYFDKNTVGTKSSSSLKWYSKNIQYKTCKKCKKFLVSTESDMHYLTKVGPDQGISKFKWSFEKCEK